MSATSAPIYPNARMDALAFFGFCLKVHLGDFHQSTFTNTGHKYRLLGQDHSFSGDPAPVIYPNTRMDVSLPDLVSCRLLDYIFPAYIKL